MGTITALTNGAYKHDADIVDDYGIPLTGSFTLASDKAYLMGIQVNREDGATVVKPTINGGGWTEIADNLWDDGGAFRARLTVYARYGDGTTYSSGGSELEINTPGADAIMVQIA